MPKKILIATGGTGGHIYPSIALAERLIDQLPDCKILFIGGGLSRNRFFDQSTYPFHTVACGAFNNKAIPAIISSVLKIGKGIWESHCIIDRFDPDVAVGFGSFYSFPPMIAAKLKSVPLVLHEANSIPGKVNRLLSRHATVSGVHFPQTIGLLKGRVIEVGMPLRKGYRNLSVSRADARRYFGLSVDTHTLLVFGGSQGAKGINTLVSDAILKLNDALSLQVLHFTGDALMAEQLNQAYASKKIHSVVKPFENRMDLAWQSSDMVVSRSGASTIAEQLEFEVPSILIPYPQAADNHQEYNANFIVDIVGGGIKLLEREANPHILAMHLQSLIKNDGSSLTAMKQAMKDYKHKARRRDLFSLVEEVLLQT